MPLVNSTIHIVKFFFSFFLLFNLSYSLLRHAYLTISIRLLMLACRVFGAPPAPILAESVHPCSAETTSVIDKPVLRDMKRNRNTFCSFLDTDGFPSHVSHLYILQPASVPEIPEEFLRDFQMKIFPSAMSAVPQFLGFINPTPTKSHKHALFHEQSGSFHLFSGLPTAYKGQEKKSQQLNN